MVRLRQPGRGAQSWGERGALKLEGYFIWVAVWFTPTGLRGGRGLPFTLADLDSNLESMAAPLPARCVVSARRTLRCDMGQESERRLR